MSLYQCVFRPVIEYCSSTYHAMLTSEQAERLERLQSKALKVIYGWNRSSVELMSLSGLESLRVRREKQFENFARKCAVNPVFTNWFEPFRATGHNTRNKTIYHEPRARQEQKGLEIALNTQ